LYQYIVDIKELCASLARSSIV